MARLGHVIGVVVYEGVETAEQAAALRGWGCDQPQGHHFGRPMLLDRLLARPGTPQPGPRGQALLEQAVPGPSRP